MEAEQLRARQDWSSGQPDVYHLFEPVIILRILLGDILRLIEYELFRYKLTNWSEYSTQWRVPWYCRYCMVWFKDVLTYWCSARRSRPCFSTCGLSVIQLNQALHSWLIPSPSRFENREYSKSVRHRIGPNLLTLTCTSKPLPPPTWSLVNSTITPTGNLQVQDLEDDLCVACHNWYCHSHENRPCSRKCRQNGGLQEYGSRRETQDSRVPKLSTSWHG